MPRLRLRESTAARSGRGHPLGIAERSQHRDHRCGGRPAEELCIGVLDDGDRALREFCPGIGDGDDLGARIRRVGFTSPFASSRAITSDVILMSVPAWAARRTWFGGAPADIHQALASSTNCTWVSPSG